MHRRPLGRGRTLATIAGLVIVVGCVLPWWNVGGTSGIPAVSGNGLEGSGIIVFLCGIVTLALVALPYAAGDRPLGLDRWLSFAMLAVVGWLGLRRPDRRPASATARSSSPSRPRSSPTARACGSTGAGLVMLARAAYTMSREPVYR